MKILDNLFVYNHSFICCNTTVIKKNKTILIDPGTTSWRNFQSLLKQLKKDGINEIDEIWVTHCHPDHAQGTKFIKNKFKKAKVRAHPIAKKILESEHPRVAFLQQQIDSIKDLLYHIFKGNIKKIKTMNWIVWILVDWAVKFITKKWEKVVVDYTFQNEEIIDGIKVFYLPGHSPDEVGFFLLEERILVSGDLIAEKKLPITALNVPASDITQAINSLKIIQKLNPQIIFPPHNYIIKNTKSTIKNCLENTEKLRKEAINVVVNHSSPYKVMWRWWRLYPKGCRLQQRLCMWGILAKEALLNNNKNYIP